LLIATDPDSDRVGIAAPNGDGTYALFSGNEVGALLLEYIITARKEKGRLPNKPVAVKSIVSTTLADKVCAKYGVELRGVLTGFKYIGEQIALLEKDGRESDFIFGFEESYGYLGGTYARDKDAVIGAMLIAEWAAYNRDKGISLVAARDNLYKEYGFYFSEVDNLGFEGAAGLAKMNELMTNARKNPPKSVNGVKVTKIADYYEREITDTATGDKQVISLPKSNVLIYTLDTAESIVVRPSGTEPKIKIYYTAIGKDNMDEAKARQKVYSTEFKRYFLGE
jgi:phosphoglucomutase